MVKAMKTTRIVLLTAVLAIGLVLVLGVRLNRATEDEIVTHFSQRQLAGRLVVPVGG